MNRESRRASLPSRDRSDWPLRIDLGSFAQCEAFPEMLKATGERAVIIRDAQGSTWSMGACLCYWPGDVGVGRPVCLTFRNITAAQEFWALNFAYSKAACPECFAEEREPGRALCFDCLRMMDRLGDLERRYKAAENHKRHQSATWKRIQELEEKFKSEDFTTEDKAAVLDQIMHDMASMSDEDGDESGDAVTGRGE